MVRKTLNQVQLGSLVLLELSGKLYLHNAIENGDAVLVDETGQEKIVSLDTLVYVGSAKPHSISNFQTVIEHLEALDDIIEAEKRKVQALKEWKVGIRQQLVRGER